MIHVRKAADRGHVHRGGLNTFFISAFASSYDSEQRGLQNSALRAINEHRLEPGQAFDPYSLQGVDVITYVLEGQLEHRDSLGNNTGRLHHMSLTEEHFVQVFVAGGG
jgi:redox-sensitive bicupin YhaK (pirin superfamily)